MYNFYYLFNFLECGHFCINYCLKKEKIKKEYEYSRIFMSLGLIKRILKKYFEEVEVYKIDDIDELKGKSRCISIIKIRNKHNHYIVIEKVDNNYVYYYDPRYIFLKRVKKEKFIKIWSNIACFYLKKSNC